MIRITYQYRTYFLYSSESVLDCLKRNGVSVPNACRGGGCQSCLMRAVTGDVPPRSQGGIRNELQDQNYFLACVCVPENDLEIALPDQSVLKRTVAEVVGKEKLTSNVMRLTLQRWMPFQYKPGQNVNLYRGFKLVRSYAIAGPAEQNDTIEIHVRRIKDGSMSNWIHDELNVGDTVELGEPFGECHYEETELDRNLLLVGTGAGLATLYGVVHDAIARKHSGLIHLFHGVRSKEDLYLVEELNELAAGNGNVNYTPCVSGNAAGEGLTAGRASVVALEQVGDLSGWSVYLSGHPDMVSEMGLLLKTMDHGPEKVRFESFFRGSNQIETAL